MNYEIVGEVRFFLAAVLLGAAAAMVYDILRVWRRFRRQTLFAVSVQDFIFWFVLGIFGFRLIYYYNAGTLRFFALGGILLGACIYVWTLGRFFVKYCLKLLLFLTFPLRRGLNFLRKKSKLIHKKFRKRIRTSKGGSRLRSVRIGGAAHKPKKGKHGRKDALAAEKRK